MQLIARLDESNTHASADYMLMAGYVGRLGQWKHFDEAWRKGLRKSGLTHWHTSKTGNHPFRRKASKLADRHLMFGVVIRLDGDIFREAYHCREWPDGAKPDSMYGLCFRYCIRGIVQQACVELPNQRVTINFELESGHRNAGAPADIVRSFKRERVPMGDAIGTVTLGEKTKVPGLQAADLLANWALELEVEGRVGTYDEGPLPLAKARTREIRCPIFRCYPAACDLAKFRDDVLIRTRQRREYGRMRHQARLAAMASSSPSAE